MSNRFLRNILLILGAAGALVGGVGQGISAELRQFEPFETPSQPAPPSRETQQQAPTVPESFYSDFETKVQQSNPAEKNKATEFFTEKRNEARKAKRSQDVKHYQRLLDILANP